MRWSASLRKNGHHAASILEETDKVCSRQLRTCTCARRTIMLALEHSCWQHTHHRSDKCLDLGWPGLGASTEATPLSLSRWSAPQHKPEPRD